VSKRNDSGRKDAARVVRDQLAREQRRRQQLLTTISALVIVLIAGATGWFVYSSQQPDSYTAPKNTYQNDIGFVIGNGPKLVEIFLDYQCPACRSFELGGQGADGQKIPGLIERLQQPLAEQKVKVVYYTVAILDYTSPNKYSTRAAAAAGCAADENKISDFTQVLMDKQVEEGTAGPTDEQLIEYGQSVGLGESFVKCVKDRTYIDWVPQVNEEFENRGLTGTPSIFVGGKRVEQKENESLPAYLDRIMELAGDGPAPQSP
jgi:protein-disulfide isomerase